MLKKIRIDELRLGMHLHGLCGSWLDHPLWRTRFVVHDVRDLEKLRASGVAECWIDTAKGADIDRASPDEQRSAPANDRPRAQASQPDAAIPAEPVRRSLEEESPHAEALYARGKQTVVALFEQARMGRAIDHEAAVAFVDEIATSVRRNNAALVNLVRLKTHDEYTFLHSVAVATLMVALAQRMGQDEAQIRQAGLAGLFHDIGKALIPLEVLNKPGKLIDAEFGLVKQHPRMGHELLRRSAAGDTVLDVCLHHHERPDGNGYPEARSGEALGVAARMAAICDVYDAITSSRPYKDGWLPAEAIASMARWTKAGQFDAAVFKAFVASVGIYPVGSLVRMQSERLAVVIERNETSLLAPRVKVFYSLRSETPVPIETIDLGRHGCRERIAGLESNSQWRFPYLDELALAHLATRSQDSRAARRPSRTVAAQCAA